MTSEIREEKFFALLLIASCEPKKPNWNLAAQKIYGQPLPMGLCRIKVGLKNYTGHLLTVIANGAQKIKEASDGAPQPSVAR